MKRPAPHVLGASALAVVLAGTTALTTALNTAGATAPTTPVLSARAAVDPVPVELADESSDIAAGKAHARAAAEQAAAQQAAAAAAEQAAAAAAQQAAAQQAAAQQAAADRATAAERASRSARSADPRAIARSLLAARGQAGQFSCLDSLWTKESDWRWDADNPTSSAYGIPQSLPGSKMASAGADWATNPETQIRWGLDYIAQSYGTPCAAWQHSKANNWY